MDEMFLDDEITEEARARRRAVLALLRKSLTTLFVIAGFLGLLLPLTIYLHWGNASLACLLGLLSGVSILFGIATSRRTQALITTLLGVLILPGIAVYLSLMAARGPEALETASAVMTPFVVYALAGLAGGSIVTGVWRTRADAERARGGDQAAPGAPPEVRTGNAATGGSRKEHET